MTGLVAPTQGRIEMLGVAPNRPEELFHRVGYCAQYDSFARGVTGFDFIYGFLLLHGLKASEAKSLTRDALKRVDLEAAAHRMQHGSCIDLS